MASRRPRMLAGVPEVLAALTASTCALTSLTDLMAATGLSAGATARALVELQSLGWLCAPQPAEGFRLAPVLPAAEALPPAQPLHLVSTGGRARNHHQLTAIGRWLVDLGVDQLPFLDALTYREQLRAAVAQRGPFGQLAQASTALRLRTARPRPCRWGRHSFLLHRDSSTSVGHSYFECTRCGAFLNSLFGDAVDRRTRRVAEPSH